MAEGKPKRVMPVGRRFQKGQSGNPAGRPKDKALRVFLDEANSTGEATKREGIHQALYVLAIKPGRDQLKAIELLKAYDEGRPKAAVELTGKDGGPLGVAMAADDMTTGGLRRQLEELRRRREEMGAFADDSSGS